MAKTNAVVGIVKCPVTSSLYGVRVEIEDNKKWIATWAFPIKSDVAKREGYAASQFPPDISYATEFPGCPYCKIRENIEALSKPKSHNKGSLRINVSSPNFDDIGSILKSLRISYNPFNEKQFDCDLLFLNCGTPDSVDPDRLRKFVENGGCVYASDLTDTIINSAFPGLFGFSGHTGLVCRIFADVIDLELREIIGSRIQIEFDKDVWALLTSSKGVTLLSAASEGRYPKLPIMVKVGYGKGTIYYTCFHNHSQASDKEKALLQLLVLKQIGSSAGKSLLEVGSDYGVDMEKIK